MDALTLILTGGALALVLYPLWQRQTRPTVSVDYPGQSLAELGARYQAALAAIRDLMFDYDMGKIAAEDYPPLLHKAKLRAAHLRQQLDQSSGGTHLPPPGADTQIEAAVAALKNSQTQTDPGLQAQVAAEITALKQNRLCPQCGYMTQPGDVFCAKCGSGLDKNTTAQKTH